MNASEIFRLPDPRTSVRFDAREVVRNVSGVPHIFIRVRVTGWRFPLRAPEPFMLIGTVVSQQVVLSRDGLIADAYFSTTLPSATQVTMGYGNVVSWDFNATITQDMIPQLDRARVPPGTIDQLRGGR